MLIRQINRGIEDRSNKRRTVRPTNKLTAMQMDKPHEQTIFNQFLPFQFFFLFPPTHPQSKRQSTSKLHQEITTASDVYTTPRERRKSAQNRDRSPDGTRKKK